MRYIYILAPYGTKEDGTCYSIPLCLCKTLLKYGVYLMDILQRLQNSRKIRNITYPQYLSFIAKLLLRIQLQFFLKSSYIQCQLGRRWLLLHGFKCGKSIFASRNILKNNMAPNSKHIRNKTILIFSPHKIRILNLAPKQKILEY